MMEKIVVRGKNRISGEIDIQGSKNSALPIIAACALTRGEVKLLNCPMLTDVKAAINILEFLGAEVSVLEGGEIIIDSSELRGYEIPEKLMREMRSSVIFTGALISRFGRAVISSPGGCEIGLRPIDLHISSLRELGVQIKEEHGRIYCKAKKRPKGTRITLSFPSVGATENILLAAVCAGGVTTIINAAKEPEIVDLADFLNKCGAVISGAGESTVTVIGTNGLDGTDFSIIPDRIAASTFMAAAALTGGEIRLKKIIPMHIAPVIPVFEQMGCVVRTHDDELELKAPSRLKSMDIVRTMPYPGFPTDSQANIMAMSATADGTGIIIENIFESRYKNAAQLNKMGAKISVEGRAAVIQGVPSLFGTQVTSTDLRGGAALIVAALGADGETEISNVCQIDRGYLNIEDSFRMLGADIRREISDET